MENWIEDFILPTKQYSHLMKKYRDFLNAIFKLEVVTFGYGQWLKNNLASIFDDSPFLEHYLENKAYQDSPLYVNNESITSGYRLTWPGYDKKGLYPIHSQFQNLIKDKLNIDVTLCITDKAPSTCRFFFIHLALPNMQGNHQQEKTNIVLQDFINNLPFIEACLQQLKCELFQITARKDFFRVDQKNLSRVTQHSKPYNFFLSDPGKHTALLKMGIIDENDLNLLNCNLSYKEEMCLELYTENKTIAEIAEEIHRSPRTIEMHLNNIKSKMQVSSKDHLLVKAKKLFLLRKLSTPKGLSHV